jgi:hypothetical protein
MLAVVHGDASFPATECDPFRSLKPRKTMNRKNPVVTLHQDNKQTKPIEWLGFSKSKQKFASTTLKSRGYPNHSGKKTN